MNFLDLSVRSEHVHDLVSYHVFYGLSRRFEILTRVEMVRMLSKVLADVSCHCETDIRIDVDLAYRGSCRLTELILRDADGVWHVAAILIDHLYELLRYG